MIMFINPIQEKLVKSGAKENKGKKERQAAKAAKALATDPNAPKQDGGAEGAAAEAKPAAEGEKPAAAEEA